MVSVLTLHKEVELLLNRLNTNWDKDIDATQIDSYLNMSKDLILSRYDELVEKNRTLSNDIRELSVPDEDLGTPILTNSVYNTYKLPKEYYNYLKVNAIGKCKDVDRCSEVHEIETTTWFSNDKVNEMMKSDAWKPSWDWRSGLYTFSGKGLLFYHNNAYDLQKVFLTYVKWIPNVYAVSLVDDRNYVLADGTVIKEDVDLNINERSILWRKLVQVTAYMIKKGMGDNPQLDISSILFNENLGIV